MKNGMDVSKDYKVGFEASRFPYTWDDVALVEAAVGIGGGLFCFDIFCYCLIC